jgi:hypothetical protein
MQTTSFENWRREVDRVIADVVGMTADDLPDVDYRGLYATGNTPEEAAVFVVGNAADLPEDQHAAYWRSLKYGARD